uniref:DUF4216 domain-containing protein n=1 Tax=Setaria viridis TaxID=4556 RepID=A0A4U6SYZ6_SETVI|nr:hypothetical protein SEVIR_9G285500v2 [Setaria viridis]
MDHRWRRNKISFNNQVETREPPVPLDGEGNIDWYGVVKIIYALDFLTQQEVILFQCDWYDLPAANRSKGSKKQDWSTVIRMNPRNVFFIPELDNQEEIDIDSLDVRVGDMIELGTHEDLTNWTRTSVEGVTGDASVIEKALAESVPEPTTIDVANEDEEDNTDDYIDDGYIKAALDLSAAEERWSAQELEAEQFGASCGKKQERWGNGEEFIMGQPTYEI